MKIGQIDVMFAVARTKTKHRVIYEASFKGYIEDFFFGERSKFISSREHHR